MSAVEGKWVAEKREGIVAASNGAEGTRKQREEASQWH